MCFYVKISSDAVKLQNRFKAMFRQQTLFDPAGQVSGFAFPMLPVITREEPDEIRMYQWGLIPAWAKDPSFRKNTLNARCETVSEKPSFRNSVANRCLVLVDGFYEWKWLDEAGKRKEKYLISTPDGEPFAIGGLYNHWLDKTTGEIVPTFTVLTTEANPLMAEIHNTKRRMPFIPPPGREREWLNGAPDGWACDPELVAHKL